MPSAATSWTRATAAMITSSCAARWSSSSSARASRASLARWATSSRAIDMVAILGSGCGPADRLIVLLSHRPRRLRAVCQQYPQPRLVQHRHAERERLVVLAAGVVARHQEVGLL